MFSADHRPGKKRQRSAVWVRCSTDIVYQAPKAQTHRNKKYNMRYTHHQQLPEFSFRTTACRMLYNARYTHYQYQKKSRTQLQNYRLLLL